MGTLVELIQQAKDASRENKVPTVDRKAFKVVYAYETEKGQYYISWRSGKRWLRKERVSRKKFCEIRALGERSTYGGRVCYGW